MPPLFKSFSRSKMTGFCFSVTAEASRIHCVHSAGRRSAMTFRRPSIAIAFAASKCNCGVRSGNRSSLVR